jgi:hypothetical protein
MQSESHEIFALGLTTPSLTANEDGHKQVIKETIAAIDDKLDNAQKGLVGQNQEANNEGSTKVQVLVSPPEPTIPKDLSSQQRKSPATVHHVNAPSTPPATYQEGVITFRVFDHRKPRQGKKSQLNKDGAGTPNRTSLGMKDLDVGKASTRLHPLECQKVPPGGSSTSAVKQPYNEHLTSWRSNPQRSVASFAPATPKIIQPGCKASQSSAINDNLKAPSALPSQSKPDWRSPTRTSISSSKDSRTIVRDENTTSPRRSSSPMSECTSSNPRSFVYLPELSLGRSASPDHDLSEGNMATSLEHQADEQSTDFAQDMLAMLDMEGFHGSYTELLNKDISTAATCDSDLTYIAASQSDDISLLGNTAPEFVPSTDFMDLDDLF